MTDVDEGTETKFGVRASTTFVGATQALVSLTPTKSGAAAFLTVADGETIPSATAAEALLAYREIDFSGTSPQIIQFALSISATQNATSGEILGGTDAVLQPSTAYKIVMYNSGGSNTLLRFTTLANIDEGYPFVRSGTVLSFDMSAYNFRTGTDGRFQVPFIFSWLLVSGLLGTTANMAEDETLASTITNADGGQTSIKATPNYVLLVNSFGDENRGAAFLHTPRGGAIRKYQTVLTNIAGNGLTIKYR
ncbi:hypothetical protein P0082_07560 [Candidatus Haliotispira prima]|uniref:Uncharacterized protein n=1 Tax=Candidatus Haliotispira prima TaxID=3034016 RepID=A0ABY8MEC7_9SPIO|nr:hypothetical protein P0082_07560 [Candidatus Haliotispira prima]